MIKFLKYIVSFLIITLIILEITIRLFGLVGNQKPKQNINNNIVLAPGSDGIWIRGGLAEIKSYFKINGQGFNSLINYDTSIENKIALIGDSYIEGFHTDVNYSVGRQLEKMLNFEYTVHEYGIAGANINDYALIYSEIIKGKGYDFIFIFITDEDLKHNTASFMNISKDPNISIRQKLYENFKSLSYMNINHGIQRKTVELLKKGPKSLREIDNSSSEVDSNRSYFEEINTNSILKLPNKVIFLNESNLLSKEFIEFFNFEFKEIIHNKLPKDNGFDEHWNKNGRYNCARAMAEYINNQSN